MMLEGKAGVITGAGRGLGRETAVLCAREGASVVAVDRDEATALETAALIVGSGGAATAEVADVSTERHVERMIARSVEEFGALDFLHNNAAVQIEKPLTASTLEEWNRLQSVNLGGVFLGCKYGVLAMQRSGGGSIVNSGSVLSLAADPILPLYTATKHGVLGLTRAVAADGAYARAGIRCNCICPGDMATPMVERYFAAQPDPEQARAEVEAHYPVGRIGAPSDVAELIVFLFSDRAALINGACLTVDGGLMAKLY